MNATIEVIGLEELRRKLTRAGAHNALVPEMSRALERIRAPLVKYPPKPTFQGHATWMTPKQRRWFFANLRAGNITVPYRRTGKLGQGWTSRVTSDAVGLEGTVGNALGHTYGRYVQDKARQAKIHQGRWSTVQDVTNRVLPTITAGFQKEINRLLQ